MLCCSAVVKNQEFHIIRLDGNVYVPGFELSSIFWERDLLKEMVGDILITSFFKKVFEENRELNL